MSNSPCNCCEQPPCAAPSLEFITVEASCTICGYALPIISEAVEADPEADPPVVGVDAVPPLEDRCLRFQRRKVRQEASTVDRVSVTSTTSTLNWTGHDEVVKEKVQNEAGECVENFFSGSLYYNEHILTEPNGGGDPIADQTWEMSTSAGSSGVWTGTFSYTNTVTPEDNYTDSATTGTAVFDITESSTWDYTSTGVYTFDFTEGSGYDSLIVTVTYSMPVTTCEPDYPEWPEWSEATSSGQSSRIKSGACKLTLTLEKTKWRVTHAPSGTCYLKVWIRKTFTPAATDPPTDPLPDPTITESTYIWNGTGNPCLPDTTKPYTHADNLITGDENEVAAPEEEGVTTIEMLKYSCCEGYEPDISDDANPQPNGFPDPLWEAEPP